LMWEKGAGLQRNAPSFLCSVRTTVPYWTLHLKNRKIHRSGF